MTKKEKILQNVAKSSTSGSKATGSSSNGNALVEQYNVIREDIMKLRDDLAHGYDMARDMLDKKTLMKELLKVK